jgi:peptidyl-prolyl cis-trans isomerase C
MTQRRLLPFSLAILLLAGLAGCNRPEEGETTGEAGQTTAAEGQTPGTPAAPSHTPGAPQAQSKPVDTAAIPEVVARVNGQEIKKAELMERCQDMQTQLAQTQGVQAPLNEAFYRRVLDSMIANALLMQEAKAEGITVPDAQIDQQINLLKSRFPSPEAFQKELANRKVTEQELRDEMRRVGTVQKLVQTKVLAGINVTDQAAKTFYDQNQDKMKQPARRHLRHILIGIAPNAAPAEKQKAREKAEGVLKRIQGGEDFAKLASENSDDPGSKTRGGDLSWVTPGQTVPPFDKAAFALKQPNDISPVVETEYGYHIIQLLETQEPSVVPFEMAKGQIVQFLQQQQTQERLRAHVEGLKSKAKVETYL